MSSLQSSVAKGLRCGRIFNFHELAYVQGGPKNGTKFMAS